MEKIIKIGNQDIKFNTSLSWAFIYKAQFGVDPLTLLIPTIKSFLNIVLALPGGLDDLSSKRINELIKNGEIDSFDIDDLLEPLYDFETVQILQILWAFAKNGDDEVPEPKEWYKNFPVFPIDIVLKEIGPAIAESLLSTKKFKALMGALRADKTTKRKSQLNQSLPGESEEV